MELTAENVRTTFFDCLYPDEVIKALPEGTAPEGAIIVEGITIKTGFDPVKIENHKKDIAELLNQLPVQFQHDQGGGFSFTAAPFNKAEQQWGEQMNAQELMLLGVAAGMVQYCMPRELWSAMPGGVPYFVVNTEGFKETVN